MKLRRREFKKVLSQRDGGRQRKIFKEFGVAVKLLLNSYLCPVVSVEEKESLQERCKSNAM